MVPRRDAIATDRALQFGSGSFRSGAFLTLFEPVRGSDSTTSRYFGILYRPSRDVRKSDKSDRSSEAPGASTTNARPTSPHFGSGTPTTAASTTAGCSKMAASTSAGYTFSPP